MNSITIERHDYLHKWDYDTYIDFYRYRLVIDGTIEKEFYYNFSEINERLNKIEGPKNITLVEYVESVLPKEPVIESNKSNYKPAPLRKTSIFNSPIINTVLGIKNE